MRFSDLLHRFDNANLRLRFISSAIMAPGALLAVYLGGFAYGLMIIIASTLGLYEWLRLVAPNARAQTVGFAGSFLVVLTVSGAIMSISFGAMLAVLFTFGLFFLGVRDGESRAGWMAMGIPYMGGSALAFIALRATPGCGEELVYFLLAVIWGTDMGAFAAGRLIGGPKLAPSISPSKTWAGLIGGMILATLFGYITAVLLGARIPSLALLLSPVVACVAQAGDLFESHFKRRAGVKESGDLIPGHGGVLDRIDGLVFGGTFVFLFQAALGNSAQWW